MPRVAPLLVALALTLAAQQAHYDGFKTYPVDPSIPADPEVETGAVVFFHGYLLHRSRRNRGRTTRRVLVNHYCNGWSLLPWQIRPGESAATADRRAVIPVSGVDPYAWKGYETPPERVHLRRCKAGDERLQQSEDA